jgi:hypothetical protein
MLLFVFGSSAALPVHFQSFPEGFIHTFYAYPFPPRFVPAQDLYPRSRYAQGFRQHFLAEAIRRPFRWRRGYANPKKLVSISQDFIARGPGLHPDFHNLF